VIYEYEEAKMRLDAEDRIKEISKALIVAVVVDGLGSMVLALALIAKFAFDGGGFLPFVNDDSNVNVMLGLGLAIMIWGGYKIATLLMERNRLENE